MRQPGKTYPSDKNRTSNWPKWNTEWRQRTKPVCVRLDPDTFADLKRYAREHHTTVTECVRTFIVWSLDLEN